MGLVSCDPWGRQSGRTPCASQRTIAQQIIQIRLWPLALLLSKRISSIFLATGYIGCYRQKWPEFRSADLLCRRTKQPPASRLASSYPNVCCPETNYMPPRPTPIGPHPSDSTQSNPIRPNSRESAARPVAIIPHTHAQSSQTPTHFASSSPEQSLPQSVVMLAADSILPLPLASSTNVEREDWVNNGTGCVLS